MTNASDKFEKITAIDNIMNSPNDNVSIPPENDTAFKNELTNPSSSDAFISKDLRISKLDKFEKFMVKRVFFYRTYLDSIMNSFGWTNDENMNELKGEVGNDIRAVLNISVSEAGWLIEQLLTQRKKLGLMPEKNEPKGFLNKGGS